MFVTFDYIFQEVVIQNHYLQSNGSRSVPRTLHFKLKRIYVFISIYMHAHTYIVHNYVYNTHNPRLRLWYRLPRLLHVDKVH